VAEAAFVAISGLDDPLNETPDDYAGLLAAAQARGLDLLCANPDVVVRVGERLIWCAGAVANAYAALGGAAIMAGKPHPPIYRLAETEIRARRGALDKSRILAIGDGAATDAAGANRFGIDVLFVASGIHRDAMAPDGRLSPDGVAAALATAGAHARYAAAALA
jgi:HAD superfamily hydrolase (TIGR01459 family)